MAEPHKVVVILAYHSGPAPSLQEVTNLFTGWTYSVARYWRDNARDVLDVQFDPIGPLQIQLPVLMSSSDGSAPRALTIQRARDAASTAGYDLSSYTSTVVVFHPGTSTSAAGTFGYDSGAIGDRCAVPAFDNTTFYNHEIAHTLGFKHSYGILNTGADWDGAANGWSLYPVYGDPYDLMSSATFGGATSAFALPSSAAGYVNSGSGGPMLARAQLHYYKPAPYEATGRVAVVQESAPQTVRLYPAGLGEPGKPELVVYHPDGEDGIGTGRLYVELRGATGQDDATIWDSAFDNPGASRRGVIVHYVAAAPGTDATVWYGGRLVFPSPDNDVTVNTPLGLFSVLVPDTQIAAPPFVDVTIRRGTSRPFATITEKDDTTVTVTGSETRKHPDWPMLDPFTWEKRETTRTVTYTPHIYGVGVGFPKLTTPASDNSVQWLADGTPIPAGSGRFDLPGGTQQIDYSIDPDTHTLTLRNHPTEGTIQITLTMNVSDTGPDAAPGVLWVGTATYEVDGLTEGWGDDFTHFMDFLDHLNNPIPQPHIGIPDPDPDPWRDLHQQLKDRFQDVIRDNPARGRQFQDLVDAREAALNAQEQVVAQRARIPWLQRIPGHR
jgi:hypothetical protein